MLDSFPAEISQDILLRLPIKCLLRCTAVRKSWRSMIKNPRFIDTHLKRTLNSGTKLLFLHGVNVFDTDPNEDEDEESYWLYYDAPAFDEYCKIEVPSKKRLYNGSFRVVGTCNGLVCLADDYRCYGYNFVILNPIIRKSVTLPKPNVRFKTHGGYDATIGFAFDAVTNNYKVVRLVTLLDLPGYMEKTVAEVYSLATGLWSYLGSVKPSCCVRRNPQAFVNGVLHWDAFCPTHLEYSYFILTFDVASELFSEIMMPKGFEGSLNMKLSVSGDGKSIALFTICESRFYPDRSFLDIWEMQEYGVHESWTKLIRLCPEEPYRSIVPRSLCFWKSGELVVSKGNHDEHKELFALKLASKQFKSLGICGFRYYSANSLETSLILLDMDSADSY